MRTGLFALAAVATVPCALAKYIDTFQLRLQGENWCIQPEAAGDRRNGTFLELAKCEDSPKVEHGQLWHWRGDQIAFTGTWDHCIAITSENHPVLALCDEQTRKNATTTFENVTATEWKYSEETRQLLCASTKECLSSIYAGEDKPPTLFISWRQRASPIDFFRQYGGPGGFRPLGRLGTVHNPDSDEDKDSEAGKDDKKGGDDHSSGFGRFGRVGTVRPDLDNGTTGAEGKADGKNETKGDDVKKSDADESGGFGRFGRVGTARPDLINGTTGAEGNTDQKDGKKGDDGKSDGFGRFGRVGTARPDLNNGTTAAESHTDGEDEKKGDDSHSGGFGRFGRVGSARPDLSRTTGAEGSADQEDGGDAGEKGQSSQ